MSETWRDIPGYENFYRCSDKGRIFSVRKNLVMKCFKSVYEQALLSINGVHSCRTVHSLVALTFIGPRPAKYQINHKDGNKHNNELSNLEYVTMSENMLHSYKYLGRRNGTSNKGRYLGNAYRSVSIKQFNLNGTLVTSFDCVRRAAIELGISETAISNALHGRCKTSGGFIWQYD